MQLPLPDSNLFVKLAEAGPQTVRTGGPGRTPHRLTPSSRQVNPLLDAGAGRHGPGLRRTTEELTTAGSLIEAHVQ